MKQPQQNSLSPSRLTAAAALSIVVIVCAVYHRIPFQEIANYDEVMWVGAVEQPGLATLKRIFTWDLTWGEAASRKTGYYAPMTASSIMIDVWIGKEMGTIDGVLKSTNLALHVLNSLAVLWLMRFLGFGLWISFTAALIFGIHPLQVSTVAWAAERKNLLMGLFFLVGLVSYCKYRHTEKSRFYWGALAAYCLSLLSKPAAVIFGPCMIVTDWFLFDKRATIRSLSRAAPFLAIGLLWTFLVTATEGTVANSPPLWDRILLFPLKILLLFGKFICPVGLTLIYPPIGIDPGSPLLWLPAALLVILGSLLVVLHRFIPVWGLLWGASVYILNLIPSSGIVPFSGMNELYVADHYQYLALAGASLAAAVTVDAAAGAWSKQKAVYIKGIFTLTVIFVLGTISINLVPVWDNGETLWKDVIAKNPKSGTAHYNFGHYLDKKGRRAEATGHYEAAIAVDESLYQAHHNLGILMLEQGRLDAAAEHFRKALDKKPTFGDSHLALAKILFFRASYKDALEHCRKARSHGADCRPEELQEAIRAKQMGLPEGQR